tara:strand:- start:262 stop:2202 length:1941 start_codon:yes stop_codon:yes gene_type:complete
MCGIFGVINSKPEVLSKEFLIKLIKDLFVLSETRGKEAAGIALRTKNNIEVYKEALRAKDFIKSKKFNNILQKSITKNIDLNFGFSFIGHSRLVTNGQEFNNKNNQPIITEKQIGIHNGIITNESELWALNRNLSKETELDTEILFKLMDNKIKDLNYNKYFFYNVFSSIKGTASIASFPKEISSLILATNTGSIYSIHDQKNSLFIFASEKFILEKVLKKNKLNKKNSSKKIIQLKAYEAMNIDLSLKNVSILNFSHKIDSHLKDNSKPSRNFSHINLIDHTSNSEDLKRCSKCILPSTYPYMDFDSNGVCRYCRNFKSFKVKGHQKLNEELNKYRSNNNKNDCIVALSGGRDSCYGIHYLKKELGMNPIAFTYDWGFVTDLARRNAARVCGKLGIELIIRSPNIEMKRNYVRQNVKAWLKRPELGMIPLFMAGDKAFYYHANLLKKETGIKLSILCSGNRMETAYYKFGLSGLRKGDDKANLTSLGFSGKVGLLKYYLKNFLKNPSYLNFSLLDSAIGFFHTFIRKEDSLKLYDYIDWDEKNVVNTIINEYEWETSPETETTWRIGDATASFYNYIYSTMAGFTEDDDMLSNMIRSKYITREEALRRSHSYGKPRYESIREYLEMISLNYNEVLKIINSAKKLY